MFKLRVPRREKGGNSGPCYPRPECSVLPVSACQARLLSVVRYDLFLNVRQERETHSLTRCRCNCGRRGSVGIKKTFLLSQHLNRFQEFRFVTYPTEFVKTRSQFGGKVCCHSPIFFSEQVLTLHHSGNHHSRSSARHCTRTVCAGSTPAVQRSLSATRSKLACVSYLMTDSSKH